MKKLTLKDKLIIYTSNKLDELDSEKEELRRILRRQPIDAFDMYELLLMEMRLEIWKEFVNDLYKILFNCDR